MVVRSFDFIMSRTLGQFFRECEDIRLRAWGASEFGDVHYITLDGGLQSGGECVIAYGACGVLDRRKSDELGRLSLRGFPSSLIRKAIGEDERKYFFSVDVNMVPDDRGVMRVGGLNLFFRAWGEVQIIIRGFGEYREVRITVRSSDGLDEWVIDPDGSLNYLGPEDKGMERMPTWLRKAWLEYR